MRRALAFCRDIKSSKLVQKEFTKVIESYVESEKGRIIEGGGRKLDCQVRHVDGTDHARKRAEHLNWLQEQNSGEDCHILSNARCLAEGVDVPSLDAILFMHPRKSQIDVVQAVGRVMRRAQGKDLGYVILPVGIPAGIKPEDALNDNKRYSVIWNTLNALRSHDERLEATINKAGLGIDVSKNIEIVAVSDKLPQDTKPDGSNIGQGTGQEEKEETKYSTSEKQGQLIFDEWSNAVIAKIVPRCGRRDYWEDWAQDIAKIAKTHVNRIRGLVRKPGKEKEIFQSFLAEIRDDLNDSITEDDTIEMLAQHLITLPVFEALFGNQAFVRENPVSQAMHQILEMLRQHNIDKESTSLRNFYSSVKRRVAGIDEPKAKQRIVADLYDRFLRNAFPQMARRLGIVYTPVEIVDFILHSVNNILNEEFRLTLGSQGVHIVDPFTGTGTFITRLLQSRLIEGHELEHKYQEELHANEIVLLAYYIATVNIEAAYQDVRVDNKGYAPFVGMCLTDTFQLYEQDKDLVSEHLIDNSNRRIRQKQLEDIRVIVGNPPYSAWRRSANIGLPNVKYPKLDKRIKETYAARAQGLRSSLYDSYIRAIRWASDRIGKTGVVGYVTNAGWLEGKVGKGVRSCLAEEFNKIYILHLRGNSRVRGEKLLREGDNVFTGSRTSIAILLLAKNGEKPPQKSIYFLDIGDGLSREAKLSKLDAMHSIEGGRKASPEWTVIVPDRHGDWINQRVGFPKPYISMGGAKGEKGLFSIRSVGVSTSRDAWVYNNSRSALCENMSNTIDFYNDCALNSQQSNVNDPTKISWSDNLRAKCAARKELHFKKNLIRITAYRPFNLRFHYYDANFNDRMGRTPQFFPDKKSLNKVICITGLTAGAEFSVLMTKDISNLHFMASSQCFPLHHYHTSDGSDNENLLDKEGERPAISDRGMKLFHSAYPEKVISKEEIFYYTYGFLHSTYYRNRFANTLDKEFPGIWPVKKYEDFLAFVEAGRALGKLHCDFNESEPFPVVFNKGEPALVAPQDLKNFYRVTKMKFARKESKPDKSTVIYNSNITISGIPLDAYNYVVNGKSALAWVMERQQISVDKDSGIVNDPNDFANEAMGDPAYPLKLFQRIITVSMETLKIVEGLPPLDLGDKKK